MFSYKPKAHKYIILDAQTHIGMLRDHLRVTQICPTCGKQRMLSLRIGNLFTFNSNLVLNAVRRATEIVYEASERKCQ